MFEKVSFFTLSLIKDSDNNLVSADAYKSYMRFNPHDYEFISKYMGKSVNSLEVLWKIESNYPSVEWIMRNSKYKVFWLGLNFVKITLHWESNQITIQFAENKVIFENTFWEQVALQHYSQREQDSTGIDEWELDINKFADKVVEIINDYQTRK